MADLTGVDCRVAGRARRRRWALPAILVSPIGGALMGMVLAWLIGMLVGGAR